MTPEERDKIRHALASPPIEPDLYRRVRAEIDAMARAGLWVDLDPFYGSLPITQREEALMKLALRCLTMPTETDIALVDLEEKVRE